MPKKFYVVWSGREAGVFTDWATTKRQVDQFPGAKYKSFPTRVDAEVAYATGWGGGGKCATGSKRKTTSPARAAVSPSKAFDLSIYCDGGCEPNPGKAGSGVAVYEGENLKELWYGCFNPNGTNNTAELNAFYQALLIAQSAIEAGQSVQILCDSQYSIKCITLWAYSWKKAGWKKKTGEIKNLAVIQQCHTLYESMRQKISISHVKAHVGIEGNELADRMTIYAVDQKNTDFSRYSEKLDLSRILAMRAG